MGGFERVLVVVTGAKAVTGEPSPKSQLYWIFAPAMLLVPLSRMLLPLHVSWGMSGMFATHGTVLTTGGAAMTAAGRTSAAAKASTKTTRHRYFLIMANSFYVAVGAS